MNKYPYLKKFMKNASNEYRQIINNLDEDGKSLLNDFKNKDSKIFKLLDEKTLINSFLVKPEDFPMLYHYTSITGFKGIISSKNLYISTIHDMNDKKEMIYVHDLYSDIVKRITNDEFEVSSFLKNMEETPNDFYVMSFSYNDHSQALQNYGDIAIGMPNQGLQYYLGKEGSHGKEDFRDFDENDYYAFPLIVDYDYKEQIKNIDLLIRIWIAAFRNINIDYDDMNEICFRCKNALLLCSLSYKNPVLYQEEEIRYVIMNRHKGRDIRPNTYFNGRASMKVPFETNLISEIIYNHKLDVESAYLSKLLSKNGYDKTNVSGTKLPY